MTDEFLENLGLEIQLPETPAEDVHENDTKADSVADETENSKEEVETNSTEADKVKEESTPEKDSYLEELEKLRKENENLNKRLKDTQRSLTQKSEELKNARKHEDVADSVEESPDEDDDWFSDSEKEDKSQTDSSLEDLQSKLNSQAEELRQLKEFQEKQFNQQALSAWQKAEQPIIEKYPDYSEIVDGPFLDAINKGGKTGEFLMQEFREKGGTPEAAYEVAKNYCNYIGYKSKSTPKEVEKSKVHKTFDDPDFNSAPPSKNNSEPVELDPLDSFYANR
jgi:hypothetical protein